MCYLRNWTSKPTGPEGIEMNIEEEDEVDSADDRGGGGEPGPMFVIQVKNAK